MWHSLFVTFLVHICINSDLREPQLQKSHGYFNHRDSVIFHLLEANLNFQFQTNGSLHRIRASMVFNNGHTLKSTKELACFRCSDSGVRRKVRPPHRCFFFLLTSLCAWNMLLSITDRKVIFSSIACPRFLHECTRLLNLNELDPTQSKNLKFVFSPERKGL